MPLFAEVTQITPRYAQKVRSFGPSLKSKKVDKIENWILKTIDNESNYIKNWIPYLLYLITLIFISDAKIAIQNS